MSEHYSLGAESFRYRHAAQEFGAYCDGKFSPIPIRYVGIGHASAPNGWPVYRCEVCGDEIFIDKRDLHQQEANRV